MDGIHPVHKVQWWSLANMVMNLGFQTRQHQLSDRCMEVQRRVVQLICGGQLASSKHRCTAVYVTTLYVLQHTSG